MKGRLLTYLTCIVFIFFYACNTKKKIDHPLFVALNSKQTGIDFSNNLTYSPEFNLFKYMYFYNGSGVGAGDFNNDGKTDLFFASNQQQNKIYLNEGKLKFKDVTAQASIPQDGGWSTGVSVVDINNDGLLDIYVCRVGHYETLHSKNQLLINTGIDKNGIPHFVDKAKEYGLDFSGFSTQAAFFDYDNDGDLDMFLLNHSVHQNNNFRPRDVFKGTYDSLSGDRIFRNDGEHFTDVTKQTGINSTAISYGLGVVVADINLDGYPDLYIGNDFHENDYLYINQKNGTFKEEGQQCLMHTSQYSMGVDVADINNDALPEIVSMDMLPSDPYILKRSLGEDSYDIFYDKIAMGYSYQYARNNLQFNRGNGMFSEVGLYSGVASTDWSWAPLWMDFDNDGLKDLFISNGIPKRMNDIDFINFVSNGEIQQKITNNDMQGKDISLIKKFPEIKIPNKFYKNNGNLTFSDEDGLIDGNGPTYSNGAVYADFDNDGDLDLIAKTVRHLRGQCHRMARRQLRAVGGPHRVQCRHLPALRRPPELGDVGVLCTQRRQQPDGRRDDAEDLAARLVLGAVEQPGEEARGAAHAELAALLGAEGVPLLPGHQLLDERERQLLLVVAVRGEALREFRRARGEPLGGRGRLDRGVDTVQQPIEGVVLGLHLLEDGGVGDPVFQDGPQVRVLGGVVDVQERAEAVPAGAERGAGDVPGLGHGDEPVEVALEGVVDGVHERDVDLVARDGSRPRAWSRGAAHGLAP